MIYEQIADDDEISFEYRGIMIVKERNIYLSNKEESDELVRLLNQNMHSLISIMHAYLLYRSATLTIRMV